MNALPTDRRRLAWHAAFALALACIATYLYQRNLGLQPTVFADEWFYSKMARLMPLAEAIVPSYLYLWMFGFSSACGDGFLDCVRVGNLALYLAAAPFVYAIARRYTNASIAWLLAVMSMLTPLNIYTAYFMPEATYYFGFCVLSWIALCGQAWRPALQALAAGAVLGTMSQVKVHALFLLPALCLYLVYASWHRGDAWQAWLPRGVGNAALASGVTLGLKFGLGWLLAGDAGLSLLGPFYQGAVNSGSVEARLALLAPAFISARGHLMALSILLGVPLAILLHSVFKRMLRERGADTNPLHVYALLMLGAAAGVTILYTASLAGHDREGVRLHLRYYSFVFPLLWIVAAAAMFERRPASAGKPLLRWAIAALLLAVMAFAWIKLPTYWTNHVDGPDIHVVDLSWRYGIAVFLLQAAALAAWAARARYGAVLFVVLFLPLLLLVSQVRVGEALARHIPLQAGDTAGRLVHDTVPPADRAKVVVVGNDMTQIMRVQFHIDHPDSMPMQIETGTEIPEYQVPVDHKWMVVLGDFKLPENVELAHAGNGFKLLRLPEPPPLIGRAELGAPLDPVFIKSVEGLSGIEQTGRWSDSKRVVFHLAQPLPRRFILSFNGRAFGDNANVPFTVRAGSTSREFRIGWHMQPISLTFDTDGGADSITFEVPKPMSPAEMGTPGDERKLGIWMTDIALATPHAPSVVSENRAVGAGKAIQ